MMTAGEGVTIQTEGGASFDVVIGASGGGDDDMIMRQVVGAAAAVTSVCCTAADVTTTGCGCCGTDSGGATIAAVWNVSVSVLVTGGGGAEVTAVTIGIDCDGGSTVGLRFLRRGCGLLLALDVSEGCGITGVGCCCGTGGGGGGG